MFPTTLGFFAERRWHTSTIAIYALDRDKFVSVGKPIVYEKTEIGSIHPPTMDLPERAAQELMDELWRAGLRPTEGHGSAGQLGATEAHLKTVQGMADRLMTMIERVYTPPLPMVYRGNE